MSSSSYHNSPDKKLYPTIRTLFPDSKTVLIYPDDFNTNEPTSLIFDHFVNRSTGHFSSKRLAVFFRKGTYENINFPVGYWTQVLGLGETPDEVTFNGTLGVYAIPANTDNYAVGSLDTFWRSAENFKSDTSFLINNDGGKSHEFAGYVPVGDAKGLAPNEEGKYGRLYPIPSNSFFEPSESSDSSMQNKGMLWAVSQAASLRRVQITENLHLSLGNNYASGGFLANVQVGGHVNFGTQQQFCTRNCDFRQKIIGGAWSFVFVGCDFKDGIMEWIGQKPRVSSEPYTLKQIEKPFIFTSPPPVTNNIDNDTEILYLGIPGLKKYTTGTSYELLNDNEKIPIDNDKLVKVILPTDSYDMVQKAASDGIHLIFSPGIYVWGKTLKITRNNQVLLGIGMATIQAPTDGSPCIHVSSNVSGVRISGLSLEANLLDDKHYEGSSLFEWGDATHVPIQDENDNKDSDKEIDPTGAIHDLYCFVGGRNPSRDVKVQTMVRIYSNNIIGDNLWLWRADHVQLSSSNEKPNKPHLSEYHVTTWGECKCDTGLEVYGNNVVMNGLAVEHTYKDLVVWHGSNGIVNFYQSELPYDVPGHAYKDYVGYRIMQYAKGHVAKGLGVYSYFRDHDDVIVPHAIHDHSMDGTHHNSFAVWLNGYDGIKSVINGMGGPTLQQGVPVVVPWFEGKNESKDVPSSFSSSTTSDCG